MTIINIGSSLPLTGGTMVGGIILNANPSVALGAATKQYADSKGGSPLTSATQDDQVNGTLTTKFVSPAVFKYNTCAAFAIVTFYYGSGTVSLLYQYNISQVLRTSTGIYSISTTSLLKYDSQKSCVKGTVVVSPHFGDGASGPMYSFIAGNSLTTNSVTINLYNSTMRTGTATLVDPSSASPISVLIAGVGALI